jgi:hypothetical protein
MSVWPAKPHQTEPMLLEWAAAHPRLTQIDSVRRGRTRHMRLPSPTRTCRAG